MRILLFLVVLGLEALQVQPVAAQDFDTLLARLQKGQVIASQGRWQEAEVWFRDTLPMAVAVSGKGSPDEVVVNILMAHVIRDQGRTEEAEALYREAIAQLDQSVQGPSLTKSLALNGLGMLLLDEWRLEEALVAATQAAELRASIEGADSEGSLVFATDQALALKEMSRNEEAHVLYLRILASRERSVPAQNLELATLLNNMGSNLVLMDRADEAEVVLRRAIEIRESQFGPGHPSTAVSYSVLGTVLTMQGRLDVAEAMIRRAIANMPVTAGEGTLGGAYTGLSNNLLAQGRLEDAATITEQALALKRAEGSRNDPNFGATLFELGKIRLRQGRPQEALPLLVEAIEVIRATLPDRQSVHVRPLTLLAQAEELTGQRAQAATHLRQSVEAAKASFPEAHLTRTIAVVNLGVALQGWGESAEALPLLREGGLALIDRTNGRGSNDAEATRDLDDLRPVFRSTVGAAWALANDSAFQQGLQVR